MSEKQKKKIQHTYATVETSFSFCPTILFLITDSVIPVLGPGEGRGRR
jgi:hypothetical protein